MIWELYKLNDMRSKELQLKFFKGVSIEMVFVEGGTFLMGDDSSEYESEKPAHSVHVPSFYISKYQVTQKQWEIVMGENPSNFQGENHPVESVSWDDTQAFIKKLNAQTKRTFRLPLEAEWEYAARGGRYSQGFEYAGSDKLKQVGWYNDNSENKTHEVGLLLDNELGLYDMSGNVWEWCEDDYHGSYNGAPIDGGAWVDSPKRGAFRVLRGGSYFSDAVRCRPAFRLADRPGGRDGTVGFRLVLPLQSVG